VLAEADFLILPYDFSVESMKFIKYSIPTKASEYMMSGTPTILFAPKDTAIVKYAKEHNCFEIVTDNSVEALSSSIKNLILDKTKRYQLAKKASYIAEKNHNAERINSDFKKKLSIISQVSKEQFV
jgi:glycosyltransferase involved in cell wall biosynthesis